NQDGLATEFSLNERPAAEALQFMQDLIYKHKVAPEPSQESALGNQLALMQNGKLAMQITNPGANSNYMPTGMPYDVGVFPLGTSSRRGVGGGGTGWGIAPDGSLYHDGSNRRWFALLRVIPAERLVIAIAANSAGDDGERTRRGFWALSERLRQQALSPVR
ncbi:MAG: hypothetical protein M3N07_05355, partial [Pseudomonadota bacterium]|nr:hypothetical protein [Pseudomonadota bacterium]